MKPVLVSGRNPSFSQEKYSTSLSYRGDYRNCDLPYWTAEAILRRIVEVEKVDQSFDSIMPINTSIVD